LHKISGLPRRFSSIIPEPNEISMYDAY